MTMFYWQHWLLMMLNIKQKAILMYQSIQLWLVELYTEFMKQKLLTDILDGRIDRGMLGSIRSVYGIDLRGEWFCAAAILLRRRDADVAEMEFQVALRRFEIALDALLQMRTREGIEMKRDLVNRIDHIEEMTGDIEARYPETVQEYKARLRISIEEMIGQGVDEARLLTEVAIMADRSAIAEETVRLRAHIAQLRECMEKDEPVGRRIDFLVQELNREVNTISSKSQDVPITRCVVSLKAEIEKLREQLQNIE